MQITVSGKGLDVGQALTDHVENRLSDGIPKYLARVTDVNVVFSKEAHLFHTQIVANAGTHEHMIIKSHGDATEVYASFDQAADKLEKQLRRYKRKLTDHQNARTANAEQEILRQFEAKKYVLGEGEAEEVTEEAPLIIAEHTLPIETLTVSEAVMRLDLAELPALLFFSAAHGGLNVVYRRKDGNVSWVDPGPNAAAESTGVKKAS